MNGVIAGISIIGRRRRCLVWLKSHPRAVDLGNVNAKFSIALAAPLFLSACSSSPQSLIVGKWEVENAPLKMTAEFSGGGTAKITMFGQTVQGTYKVDGGSQMLWTVNGMTTKSTVTVTATELELELTNSDNQTIKYRRK
jgi:hypothetical protein